MKALTIKFPVFVLILFFITGIALLSCGEQSAASTASEVIDTSKTEVVIQDPVMDSMPVIEQATTTQQDINKDIKVKDPVIVKTTTTVQPVSKDPKTAPVTITTTTTTTTSPAPAPVVVTEPVKPAAPVKPAPVEVPKPVTVNTATPVQTDWPVPANYRSMKSPYAADNESIALGKTVYATHCKSCHGTKGDGQGIKAASLDTEMRSFLTAGFKAQAIGDVFYKTMIGRKDMPKYEKKIADAEERWAVVNYIRSL
jgi:mono/diheme cytochrome c family protein